MSTAPRTRHPAQPQSGWQQHIARWQQSGLSQAAFCQAHDLRYHQFTYWRRKLVTATPPDAVSDSSCRQYCAGMSGYAEDVFADLRAVSP